VDVFGVREHHRKLGGVSRLTFTMNGANQRTREHREDGQRSASRAATTAASERRVGREPGDRQGQHRCREIRNRQLPNHGIS
jgi:hypothetical protein